MQTSKGLAIVLAALLGTAGCLVHVEKVDDPEQAFTEARKDALKLRGQKGSVRELNVLAYDAGDRELVRVTVPLWLLRKALNDDDDESIDLDLDSTEHLDAVAGHFSMKDLERAGPGVLLEVQENDGERVLVWLR